jgi:hypothetical protein
MQHARGREGAAYNSMDMCVLTVTPGEGLARDRVH